MIYLDSSAVISAVMKNSAERSAAGRLIRRLLEEKNEIIASDLTVEETEKVLRRKRRPDLAEAAVLAIRDWTDGRIMAETPEDRSRAEEIEKRWPRVKGNDARHLAIMERLNCTTIVTFDNDFDDVEHITKIGPRPRRATTEATAIASRRAG